MSTTREPVPPTTNQPRPPRPPSRARIGVFIGGVLGLSVLASVGIAAGGDPETNPAGLLFILSPILMAAILRWTGEGWGDAGLRLRMQGNGGWYALSLLLFPLLTFAVLGLGALSGGVTFDADATGAIAAAFPAALALRMVYSAFEEFGWRGYLEPRLAALGVAPARRHVIVAAVWGVWHIPFMLTIDLMTDLSLGVYLALFLIAMVPMSFIYGVVRDRTGSVWPAVLMHGMANAVAVSILTTDAVTIDTELVFAPNLEGLVMIAGLTAVARVVWRRWGATPSVTAPTARTR